MNDADARDLERTLRRRGCDVRVRVDPDDEDRLEVHLQSYWPLWGTRLRRLLRPVK